MLQNVTTVIADGFLGVALNDHTRKALFPKQAKPQAFMPCGCMRSFNIFKNLKISCGQNLSMKTANSITVIANHITVETLFLRIA